jgi:hypothetical protein
MPAFKPIKSPMSLRPNRYTATLPLLLAFTIMQGHSAARAQTQSSSTNLYGALGLNTIPNARMDDVGTVRIGVSTLDPFANSWIGLQVAKPLSVVIRQTAEVSGINEDADRLYPGVDFKLRLLPENRARPEVAIGLQSAIGHKRMAGEYLALSKRYKDFDVTAGLGWGRYGTANHFKNPLKSLHSHFGKTRSVDGEMPNAPTNWFTGEHVGLFAGLEYFTPYQGLSLKLDYGADRYSAESAALDFNAPAPWSAGLNYKPKPWIDIGVAAQGLDKLMARLSLQGNVGDWRKEDADYRARPVLRPHRAGLAIPAQMKIAAQKHDQILYSTETDGRAASSALLLNPARSAPAQIGDAATHIANNGGTDIEKITLSPTILGLKGPQVTLMRRDLEMARAKNSGSAEEIWHNTTFTTTSKDAHKKLRRPAETSYSLARPQITLDNQISLAEEDSGALYRTSATIGLRSNPLSQERSRFFGILDYGMSVRINIRDNLKRIADLRPRAILPVRSNEDRFARRTIALDTQYIAFTHSPRSDTHIALSAGYLEEMYGGAGGEILYRPFNARWAIGAESWLALKRDPETSLNTGFNGDHLITGHLKGWYDVPKLDMTLHGKIGRYLAEDFGGTLALQKNFKNGAQLEGFVTLTDAADFDLFGGTTHAYNGIKLSLPLGGYKYVPANTKLNIKTAPFGRDIGQSLKTPLPLYELTEPFTARHMSTYWDEIAGK